MLKRTYSYLLNFCCSGILGEEINITLEGKNDKHLLSEFNALPTQEKFTSFKLKSCYEGIIWFLSKSAGFDNDYVFYVAYIGALYNTLSTLGEYWDGTVIESQRISGPQDDCNNYKQFWFSWDDGSLMVGKGSTKNQSVLLIYQPKCPFDIKQIGISGHNLESHWIFNTTNSNTTTEQEQENRKAITRYRLTLSCPASRVLLTMDTGSTIECLIMCTYDKQCRRATYKSDISPSCVLMTGEEINITLEGKNYRNLLSELNALPTQEKFTSFTLKSCYEGEEINITLEGKNDRHLLSEFNALPTQEKFTTFKLKSCYEVNLNTTTPQEQENTKVFTRYRLTLSCPASRFLLTMDTKSTIEYLIMCTCDKQCERAMYKSDISPNCVLMTDEPVIDGTHPNYITTN
ncbi:unnamed protein product [Mytilus coruscus]|uniref:Farnesoic acid O-methyl transferase domain-containing protein n=1 Tax=Mytilus coruscus TaxID=42192 RepID=A0A6J8C1H7_MYTCO|nr:unnamed protein product [Mytilus coruscus]